MANGKQGLLLLTLLLITVLVGCGGGGRDEVSDYCSYGAVSRAQLHGCIDHVNESTVDRYRTNAARYARGDLNTCLADAGPFCKDR